MSTYTVTMSVDGQRVTRSGIAETARDVIDTVLEAMEEAGEVHGTVVSVVRSTAR